MKVGVWTCDKMRARGQGGGCFTFKGRHDQRGGGAWLVYAHHTTKARGTRLDLHAPSLKQSQIETWIANMYHTRVDSNTASS